jgi:geranylgeranyl pyrophosphate synthase
VLAEYSEALGIAYQIADDLQDFSAESGADLEALRPSLILAIAHKRAEGDEERALLAALLRREPCSVQQRAELAALFERRGVLQKARELRAAYEQQAVNALRTLANPTLKGLLRRVIGKIFGNQHLIEGYCSEFEARNAAGRTPGAAPVG